MHGHQLKLLAEKEHVPEWTDISVGALYGALKRLAADGLIEEVRSEREGAYPERQIYAVTDAGRASLAVEKREALSEIVVRPDPFDLGVSRLDKERLHELDEVLSARISRLKAMVVETEAHHESIDQYLTFTEKIVLRHKVERLKSEVVWHEQLYSRLPEIIADETARKGN